MRQSNVTMATGGTTLEFCGMTLDAYGTEDGQSYIALRQACGYLSLNHLGELRRVKATAALAEGLRELRLPTPESRLQPTACLRADLVPGWLMGVMPGQIADQTLRQKFLAFQHDLYQMAWDVFGPALVFELRLAALTRQVDSLAQRLDALREAGDAG